MVGSTVRGRAHTPSHVHLYGWMTRSCLAGDSHLGNESNPARYADLLVTHEAGRHLLAPSPDLPSWMSCPMARPSRLVGPPDARFGRSCLKMRTDWHPVGQLHASWTLPLV